MDDAIWNPRHDVQERMTGTCEDIRDVGAIPDGLECGEDRDPNVRPRRRREEPGRIVEEEPEEDGRCR